MTSRVSLVAACVALVMFAISGDASHAQFPKRPRDQLDAKRSELFRRVNTLTVPTAIPELERSLRELIDQMHAAQRAEPDFQAKTFYRPMIQRTEDLLVDVLIHPLRAKKDHAQAAIILEKRLGETSRNEVPALGLVTRLCAVYRLGGKHREEDRLLHSVLDKLPASQESRRSEVLLLQANLYLHVWASSADPNRDNLREEAYGRVVQVDRLLRRPDSLTRYSPMTLLTVAAQTVELWQRLESPERAATTLRQIAETDREYSHTNKTGLDPRMLIVLVQALAERGEFSLAAPLVPVMLRGFQQPDSVNAFFDSKLIALTRSFVQARRQPQAIQLLAVLDRYAEEQLRKDAKDSVGYHASNANFVRELTTRTFEEFGLLAALRDRLEREVARFEKDVAANAPRTRESLAQRTHLSNLLRLARVHAQQGRVAAARDLFNRSRSFYVEISSKYKAKDDPFGERLAPLVAEVFREEARFLQQQGDAKNALAGIELALIGGRVAGPASELAVRCEGIAVARLVGQHDKAIEELNAARRLVEEKRLDLNPSKFPVSQLALEEARLQQDRGRHIEAITAARRCIAFRTAMGSRVHPQTAAALLTAGRAFAALGEWDEARRALDDARRVQREFLITLLPALAEPEQLTFLQNEEAPAFATTLQLAATRPTDAAMVEASAAWVINGKAMSRDALAQAARVVTDDPDVLRQRGELAAVRAQLLRLSLAEGGAAERRKSLTAREQELARALQQRGTGDAAPWVDLAAIRAALTPDEALVEVVRLEAAEGQPARYVAWIIPPRGTMRLVPLGPAVAIERAIKSVRDELTAAPERIRTDESAAEKRLREKLGPISQLVFAPIAAAAGGARRLVISPDGDLWLMPWQMMLAGDDYAIRRYSLRYVVTGRDLATAENRRPARGQPLLLANPNYDLKLGGGATVAPAPAALPGATRGLSRGLNLGSVPLLRSTALEAVAVAPLLEKIAKTRPTLLQEDQAVESAVKAVRSPRVLHLSTHGFFLPPDSPTGGRLPENPLLRCGLLLAGCNDANNAPLDREDGVLTGLELLGLDLRGTELVVLSACETALGDVQRGEGVAGLRQAFHLAGARVVVASAWMVADDETALLMAQTFERLAGGRPIHEALREAQLAAIAERREVYGTAHPYYWAAFTITDRR